MSQITMNKTDLEMAVEDLNSDYFNARLRTLKLVYPDGHSESFHISDDTEVMAYFEAINA